MVETSYQYLTKADIESPQYHDFIEEYHGKGTYRMWYRRMMWYWQRGDDTFRVFAASQEGKYVGQSCAYCVDACIDHKIIKLWWGVDAFVLSEMRGKGIGTALQRQLLIDCPAFTSAWYSPSNGAIKRKCGAKSILDYSYTYYPVSCYFSILLELVLKKSISRKLSLPRVRPPYFYSRINSLKKKWRNQYNIRELEGAEISSQAGFIASCLKENQFYVLRSEEYLRWKYNDNPRMNYHLLTVYKDDKQVGLIVFSSIKDSSVVMAKGKIVKIYESLFVCNSGLTHRRLLDLVVKYWQDKGEKLDGIVSLQSMKYCPVFIYPRPHSEVLSTLNMEKITSGYITLSDQDME